MFRKLCNREKKKTFGITDKKLYISVTLSSQDETMLLNQLKSGFKRRNKYQTKVTTQKKNQYLDIFFDPSFLAVSKVNVKAFASIEICLIQM